VKFKFSKYSGAGNDFIVIDNRDNEIKLSKSDIIRLCNRNIGIGSDGIIFLSNCIKNDFDINFFNIT
jgi:diaminopimelate epimerase